MQKKTRAKTTCGRRPAAAKKREAGETAGATTPQPPLRPAQCRAYMRRTLAAEFRGIVDGFIKGAKSGSCQHVKLATELLEPRVAAKKKESGRRTLQRWADELEEEMGKGAA